METNKVKRKSTKLIECKVKSKRTAGSKKRTVVVKPFPLAIAEHDFDWNRGYSLLGDGLRDVYLPL